MMVDQTWTVRDVTQKMVSKDGVEIEPNWCILEKLPDLDMGRLTLQNYLNFSICHRNLSYTKITV